MNPRPKRSLPFVHALGVCALAWRLTTSLAVAQDIIAVDPQHAKVEYEDSQIRVIRVTLPPGETSPMHSHPAHFATVIQGSLLRSANSAGEVTEMNAPSGASRYLDAVRHEVTNIGQTTLIEVITELKYTSGAREAANVESAPEAKATAIRDSEKPTLGSTGASAPATSNSRQPEAAHAQAAAAESKLSQAIPASSPAPNTPVPDALSPNTAKSVAGNSISESARQQSPDTVRHVTVNGVELAFVEAGQGAAILLMHDSMRDYREWQSLMPQLAQHFHVIAYSRRDHYPNAEHSGDYSYEQHAKDLIELIRRLKIGPAYLVGDRAGAAIALLAAQQAPETVKAVVAFEPPLELLLPSEKVFGTKGARAEIFRMVHKSIAKKNTEDGLRTYFDWVRGNGSWAELPSEQRDEFRANADAVQAETANFSSPPLTCESLHGVKAPTLLVDSPGASPNSLEITRKAAACLPAADKASLPIGARFSALPADTSLTDALIAFFAKN